MTVESDSLEVEWQFEAPDLRWIAEWLETPAVDGFRTVAGPTIQITDRYFDTDDWRVHRAGYSARLRSTGGNRELTLKATSSSTDGPKHRRELSSPARGASIEQALEGPGLAPATLSAAAGRGPLRELFTLRTRRSIFDLIDREGTRIGEIALDATTVRRGEASVARFSRVEVEAMPGQEFAVAPFVERLKLVAGLLPARASKLEAAMAAAALEVTRPETPFAAAGPPRRDMTAAEAARAIIAQHFAAMLRNEPGTRIGEDIEALHDMRVAARRVRAALKTFQPFVGPRLAAVAPEFQWIAAVLGEVRDLDVQVERLHVWSGQFGEAQAPALEEAAAHLQQRRGRLRQRLLTALDSRRYAALVELAGAALLGPDAGEDDAPALAAIPTIITTRFGAMEKRARQVRPSSPPQALHDLRKRVRRLRYAVDFIEPLYGKDLREWRRRLVALQDTLGDYQDAEVNGSLLHDLAGSEPVLSKQAVFALGMVAERNRALAEQLRADVKPNYNAVAGATWRKVRRTVEKAAPKR